MTLFASFFCPKLAGLNWSGLGFYLHPYSLNNQYFLSYAHLITFEKRNRNMLKNTQFPTVSAIRAGQDHFYFGIRRGPGPDGWKT